MTRRAWWRVLRLEFQLDSLLVWCASAAVAAWSGRSVHLAWFVAGTLMLVLSQAALELADGYYDFVQGAHKRKDGAQTWTGGSGALAEGALQPHAVKHAAFAIGALATVLFAWITYVWTREGGLVVGVVGAVCGAFWSMPPLRLSYRGLGEVLQGLVMGPLMAAEAWVVATGQLDARAFAVGIPFGLLELAMGLSHNIVDREDDARAGKRTLVVKIGAGPAAWIAVVAVAAAVVSLVLLAGLGVLPRGAGLVALVVLPLAVHAGRLTVRAATDARARATMGRTFPMFHVLVLAAGGTLAASLPAAWATGRLVLLVLVVFGLVPTIAALRKVSWPSVYDVGAPFYDLVSRLLFFENRVRGEAILALKDSGSANGTETRTVLDLGCGTGFHFSLLGRALPGARVVGVDPSGRSLAVAARSARRAGLTFVAVEGDGAEAPLPDTRPDAVICSFALSVMPHWREASARAASLLQEGGRFVVLEQEIERRGAWAWLRPFYVSVNRVLLGAALDRDYAAELQRLGLTVEKRRRGAYVIIVGVKPSPGE